MVTILLENRPWRNEHSEPTHYICLNGYYFDGDEPKWVYCPYCSLQRLANKIIKFAKDERKMARYIIKD